MVEASWGNGQVHKPPGQRVQVVVALPALLGVELPRAPAGALGAFSLTFVKIAVEGEKLPAGRNEGEAVRYGPDNENGPAHLFQGHIK